MADWFKFYEDFFDNPRFQYAIHQMSEVCPVTVLLLTEHCRHKSGSIRWTGDEIDLLGFSAKINVSPGKINEAIQLLQKIRYITIENGHITFLKWNELQSDYCRKIERRNRAEVQKSPEKYNFVPRDETRRDETRSEERREIASTADGALLALEANGKGIQATELMERCKKVFGGDEMRVRHGRWVKRAMESPGKLDRVLSDMERFFKDGGQITKTPAARAESLWKEFT